MYLIYFLDENGRVVVENDSIKTVPCCLRNQEDEPEDEPFCYEDISYPTGAKYVVDYFTGHGKISCEYTHESWSNGQRESFYKALNKYKPKDNWPDKADFKRYCVDYDVDTFYYKNPFFDNDSIFEEFENDSELYDLFAFSLPELISLGDLTSLGYNALKIIKKYDLERHSIDGYDRDSILKDQFSLAEMEMTEIIFGCENACEKRRDDLRKQILDTLESKCYIIDRCVSSANPNVVPEADIDTMVNALIEECKSQCFINNYTCEELNLSRLIKTPKYELGQTGGFEIELFYGLAGFPISGYHDCLGRDNSSFNYIDELSPAQYTERYYDWNGDNINDAFKCKLGDIEKEEYSWYQYTKVQQASTWNLIIDLPSMCPEPETATLEYSEGCC